MQLNENEIASSVGELMLYVCLKLLWIMLNDDFILELQSEVDHCKITG